MLIAELESEELDLDILDAVLEKTSNLWSKGSSEDFKCNALCIAAIQFNKEFIKVFLKYIKIAPRKSINMDFSYYSSTTFDTFEVLEEIEKAIKLVEKELEDGEDEDLFEVLDILNKEVEYYTP